MLCSCVTTVLMFFLFFFSSSSYRDDVFVIKSMTLSFYSAMSTSSEITSIVMFFDQRSCYVLTESQRVVHTFDEVLDTEYWMKLPAKNTVLNEKALSYKISSIRWVIQLRRIILEDQIWRSVKRRSDELYPRDLASQFKAATFTSRWEDETLIDQSSVWSGQR
jgi:hypothetical protein